jgi:hypothetical protein
MDRRIKAFTILLLTQFCLFFGQMTQAESSVEIKLPKVSNNGAFVIKLLSKRQLLAKTELEVWRAYEGEDFQLVTKQPYFNALSQVLFDSGRYTYVVKLFSLDKGQRELTAESTPAYIEVDRREHRFASFKQKSGVVLGSM